MERAYTRFKIAGVLALAAGALAFVALRFQTKDFLITTPGSRQGSQHYDRMWFDVADDLLGASWSGNTLIIERWAGTNPATTWRFDLPGEDHQKLLWVMASDNSRFAWISGSTLHLQRTADGSKPLNAALTHNPLAITFLRNGNAAVVFEDRSVDRWDAETGKLIAEWKAPLRTAERAAAEGNFVAFSSLDDGKLTVYTLQGEQWIQVQQSLAPELPERIVLPAPSVSGTMMEGRLRIAGVTRAGPGPIRSLGAHLYDVLAAGDFEGIFVLPPEDEYYRLTAAAPHSLVASGAKSFAISGDGGTTLIGLASESRLTGIGRKSCTVALGIALLAIALACAPLLLGAFGFVANLIMRPEVNKGNAPNTLGKPTADLIEACASGKMMLWAGAGLSAQSGFPLRKIFIDQLIQAASIEFAGGPLMKELKALAAGNGEGALNRLVGFMSGQRSAILSQVTAIFARFVQVSRAHDHLARLNLPSAITTNYDVLLEKTHDAWACNVKHLGEDDLDGRFLLKLYGSRSAPASVLLSKAEFQAAMDRPNVETVREVFGTHPMLFVGASLDGLLADLTALGMPEGADQTRFAVTGASGNWNKPAYELLRKFGIKAVVCTEDEIAHELPRFLAVLAGEVRAPERSISTSA
jgi:hypothetical protein